ncbi:hypothetical protein ACFXPY_17490 [Streptomyces sp. NPDC059153]|uniref:FAD binding domain-containing protein n=1 Tax=unclassified Streptomyces TaxID=2593676 RepID=UPI0036A4E2AA
MCYFIPGDFGTTTPGKRRMNWVRNVRADAAGLHRITTDRTGTAHGLTLPRGRSPRRCTASSWTARGGCFPARSR